MAYADYGFYTNVYQGNLFSSAEAAAKWMEQASDMLDVLTVNRLVDSYPDEERYDTKIKKAVCAIADAYFLVDEQRKAVSAQRSEFGEYRGALVSVASGRESRSFKIADPSASVYAAAAANGNALYSLIMGVAERYLANIPDSTGVNLLYRGR